MAPTETISVGRDLSEAAFRYQGPNQEFSVGGKCSTKSCQAAVS